MANGDPSITIWSRLEPRARADDMARSLQAQIRDPLWMLARQWQVGEFLGSDGGSPLQATIATETQPLTSYRPGPPGGATAGAIDETLPLETHVERAEVELGLRGRVQLGARLEAFLRDANVSAAGIDAFRTSYEIDAAPAAAPAVPDPDGEAWRALARGRVTDGVKAYEDAAASLPAFPAGGPSLSAQDEQNVAARPPAARRLPAIALQRAGPRLGLGRAPAPPRAGRRLGVGVAQRRGSRLTGSAAGASTGTRSSSVRERSGAGQPAQVDSREWNFIPNHVTLHGQPNATWWELEDAQTDFGSTDLEKVDLAKLLVMQFAMLYGNDWFELPLPLELGSLASVTLLVVTDTFGQRTLIRPTGACTAEPWSVFSTSGVAPERDFLMLAPTLGRVQDGDPIEDVTFLRDEMAAMGWAVEEKVPGELDTRAGSPRGLLRAARRRTVASHAGAARVPTTRRSATWSAPRCRTTGSRSCPSPPPSDRSCSAAASWGSREPRGRRATCSAPGGRSTSPRRRCRAQA